jgi:hypothetical protein
MIDGGESALARSFLPAGLRDDAVPCLRAEKRLMLAVLEGAVSDFQKYATASAGRGRRLFADAEAWLESPTSDEPLDFENICYALGFDPSFIREGLRRWRAARRREPEPSRAVLHFPFRRVTRAARATRGTPTQPRVRADVGDRRGVSSAGSTARKGKRRTVNVG